MTEDEENLFRSAVSEVKPLKNAGAANLNGRALKSAGQKRHRALPPGIQLRREAAVGSVGVERDGLSSAESVRMLDPLETLSFKRPGVQHGVFKNLRQGKYQPESRVDLHRLTVEQARQQVAWFARDCQEHGVRCALITHGKGLGREKPALLKSCVNHWLQELPQVLAFHSALPNNGGTGATYVLFKKSDKQKNHNREQFGKRGINP